MRRFLLSSFAVLFTICVNAQFSGIQDANLAGADNQLKAFVTKYNIPGVTMALAKDGKIVYLRGYGYSDVNRSVQIQPNNLFRIASLSKQITSIAIMKLMEEGKLTMASKVFGTNGILKNHPVFKNANITDARIYDITIQNLLEHSAGWNRDNNCNPNPTTPYPYFLGGCDPISYPLRVTMLTGTPNPVTKEALIKYELEKGLDFAPGTAYNYSNMGFLMLGEVIETLTGKGYEEYVKDSILSPLGIYDMHIAKNRKTEKYEREGEYAGNGYTTLSIWGDGQYVPWEYGGFNVTAMDAHGGWITTAKDLLKLLVAVDGFTTKPDILTPATIQTMVTPSANNQYYAKGWAVNQYNNWWHTGSLDGTASEQVRAANGYSWVIIANYRNITTNQFWTDLDNLGWNCISSTSVWPSVDFMTEPNVNASAIKFTNITNTSIKVTFTKGDGAKRLLIVGEDSALTSFPLDGVSYSANAAFGSGSKFGNNYTVYNDTGNSVTVTGLTANKKYYFRVVEYNQSAVSGNYALYQLGNNPQSSATTLATLPVKLTYFNANEIAANTVKLSWQTAQEVNSNYFALERSIDGTVFNALATVEAKVNSGVAQNYEYLDVKPVQGKNYYRLKMVDKDGTFEYSGVKMIDISHAFSISPNPTKNIVNIYGANARQAQVIDTYGKVVMAKALKAGNNTISVGRLTAGVYTVKVFNIDNTVEAHRLVITQ